MVIFHSFFYVYHRVSFTRAYPVETIHTWLETQQGKFPKTLEAMKPTFSQWTPLPCIYSLSICTYTYIYTYVCVLRLHSVYIYTIVQYVYTYVHMYVYIYIHIISIYIYMGKLQYFTHLKRRFPKGTSWKRHFSEPLKFCAHVGLPGAQKKPLE